MAGIIAGIASRAMAMHQRPVGLDMKYHNRRQYHDGNTILQWGFIYVGVIFRGSLVPI